MASDHAERLVPGQVHAARPPGWWPPGACRRHRRRSAGRRPPWPPRPGCRRWACPTLRVSSRASSSACASTCVGEAAQQPGPVGGAETSRQAGKAAAARRDDGVGLLGALARRPRPPVVRWPGSRRSGWSRTSSSPQSTTDRIAAVTPRRARGRRRAGGRRPARDATARRRRSGAAGSSTASISAVGRPGRDDQPVGQAVDGLVVRAPDGGRLAHDLRQPRARFDA